MSIVANIISAVLKAVVSNKVGNGLMKELVDISIGEVSEKGIEKINNFICEEKSKIDYILSKNNMLSMGIPEENIEYIVAEIKDLFSKTEITDEIIRQRKYGRENLNTFLWDEYCKTKSGHIECGNDINKALFSVAEALIKLMYTSKNFEKDILSRIDISIDSVNMEVQKISKYLENNICKLDANNQLIIDILLIILKEIQNSNMQNKDMGKKIKSKTQEYADKWNDNMFLNNFDKRDQRAGTNIKLSEVYLEEHLPHYIWKNNDEKEPSTDLKELLSEYINEKKDSQMLLVLGQPGIGKSTMITWITANFADRIDDILVYKFSSDLGKVDWKNNRVSNRILDELNLERNDLNGKILIFDGFDEVSIESNRRKDILDSLYGDWIYNGTIDNFSLIITCRENYVQRFAMLKCKYITLQPWSEMQIKSFCSIFQEKAKNSISAGTLKKLLENKGILGIPLILYMVLALNISIEQEGTIVDVYDKIFSLEGGIYDRCIDNKRFSDSHRISEVKKQIHQISRKIAIWMFENNPDEAYIPQEEYQKICDGIIKNCINRKEDLEQDFLIGNFFKLKHCEGREGKQIFFVHRSIYEYFVAETIYSSIEKSMKILSSKSRADLAKNIAVFLKQGEITCTIGKYLNYKIVKLYNKLSLKKQKKFYQWWESTVVKMMNYGMFYYTEKKIGFYKDIISKECNCFINLIGILKLLINSSERKYILIRADRAKLESYIKHYWIEYKDKNISFDLSGIYLSEINLSKERLSLSNLSKSYLSEANLSEANLSESDLIGANLCNANLSKTDLSKADLREANLYKADLRGADLSVGYLKRANLGRADLRGANLGGANLRRANLGGADLRGADLKLIDIDKAHLSGMILSTDNVKDLEKKYDLKGKHVYIELMSKVITYEEYCEKKLEDEMKEIQLIKW